MYCSYCAAPLGRGASFCNRCGANLKERSEEVSKSAINGYLTAIALLGLGGLAIMLGGAIKMSQDTELHEPVIVIFMLLTFVIVAVTEFMLVRQLSRISGIDQRKEFEFRPPASNTSELTEARPRVLAEPVGSVTDNTTRTLEYSQRERR